MGLRNGVYWSEVPWYRVQKQEHANKHF